MTLQDYLASLKGKRVAVIGIGVSNTPLIKLLLRAGVDVTACDKNTQETFCGLAEELESLGATLSLGKDYLEDLDQDVIFRTPGMHPENPALLRAQSAGSEITSEMEVFFSLCPCKIIGVTGSDGKTTTTTIIAKLLEKAGYNVFLGGNIGKPLLPEVGQIEKDDVAVVELSSFQLMTMTRSPHIAVLTNLAPNHLDIHKSMGEYISAKENIFLHQSGEDKTVFNFDNDITRAQAEKSPARVTLFSRKSDLPDGVCIRDGAICVNGRRVLPVSDILLPGEHNMENYMAAIGAVDGMVPDETIRDFARTFGGVEHRIELVREKDGVRFYNDSIASSPTRTIAGLHSFRQKVILIAGGYDKKIPFDTLGPEIVAHVKLLVLTGATSEKIRKAVEHAEGFGPASPELIEIDDFTQAVLTACGRAQPGDVVILSPACASFDKFKNFAVRGEAFKKIIYEL